MKEYRRYWNERMETISEDELRSIHEKKFLKQLKYTYKNSLFYQEKFKKVGLEPGDVKGLDDLSKLPFTEKAELRESQTFSPPLGKHQACSAEKIIRMYSSSGTTGVPTYIGGTKYDYDISAEVSARCFWAQGLRPNNICIITVGYPFVAGILHDGIERVGCMNVPVGWDTDRVIAAFQNLGADSILSTPSYIMYLMEQCDKKKVEPASLGLRLITVGGEPGGGDPSLRRKIEESFGSQMTECMGIGEVLNEVWAECPKRWGMHYIAQGVIHVELINPETEKNIDPGEGVFGEAVYTTLDKECMPLLRYRTRDQVQVFTSECECGRTGYRVKCVGRTDDMLIVLGVNVYPSAVREVIASLQPRVTGAVEIQLTERPPKITPPVKIKVEHGEKPGDLKNLKREIEELIRAKLVFRADVELVPPDTLPRFEYKARLVRKLYEEK